MGFFEKMVHKLNEQKAAVALKIEPGIPDFEMSANPLHHSSSTIECQHKNYLTEFAVVYIMNIHIVNI